MIVDSMQHFCSSLEDVAMKTGLSSNQFIPTSSCTSYVIIAETIESEYVLRVIDCKTVRIFAYSSTREQSNKRSKTRLKTESETGERRLTRPVRLARFARVRLLRHTLPISLLILRKKQTVLQSIRVRKHNIIVNMS